MIEFIGPLSQLAHDVCADRVPSRIASKDSGLWGEDAEAEARIRLGWVDAPARTRIQGIRPSKQRVVLAGMGGSALGAATLAHCYDATLTVLDSTHPDVVSRVLAEPADLIVASKSGRTVETLSHLRVGAERQHHVTVITDPGSDLEAWAHENEAECHLADPHIGGRFSVFSAYGLIPAAMIGLDVAEIIAEASRALTRCLVDDGDNPAVLLGAYLAEQVAAGRDKMFLIDHIGIGPWVEQLIAESLGKKGTGILPIVIPPGGAVLESEDTFTLSCGAVDSDHTSVIGTAAELMVVFEVATVIAARLIGVNPFDQPDVEATKEATQRLLNTTHTSVTQGWIGTLWLDSRSEAIPAGVQPHDVFSRFLGMTREHSYLGVQLFLNPARFDVHELEIVRAQVQARISRPVSLSWGPRYLHSTGQFHKGGPQTGMFLHITGDTATQLSIPAVDYSFGDLIRAQADGDAEVLANLGQPVLRLHLANPVTDLLELFKTSS